MNNKSFSQNLKKAIELRGYKQIDVARATQIPKSLLNEYLSGRCKPRKEYLTRLSNFLQVSDEWLLGHYVPMEEKTSSSKYTEIFRKNMARHLKNGDSHDIIASEIDLKYMESVIEGEIKITLEEAVNIAEGLGESLPEMFLDNIIEKSEEIKSLHNLNTGKNKWINNFKAFLKKYIESGGETGSLDKDDLLAVVDGYILSFNGYCELANKLGLSLDEMVGLNKFDHEKLDVFLSLFSRLTSEQQDIVIAQINGILSSN